MKDLLIGAALGLGGRVLLPGGRRARLSILVFHSVSPDEWGLGKVLPEQFDELMEFVSRHFVVLPLEEAVRRLDEGTLPSCSLAITFDDGYLDNVEVALPILLRYRLKATFFVSTGTLDGGMMWNDRVFEAVRQCRCESLDLTAIGIGRLSLTSRAERVTAFKHCIDRLKYLPLNQRSDYVDTLVGMTDATLSEKVMVDRADVRRLSEAGMSIGAHTVNHPILSSLDERRAEAEILESKQELTEIVGEEVKWFAYPNGFPGKDFLTDHVAIVRRLGFWAAVTTSPGTAQRSTNRFQLPRFTPWDREPAKFGARLLLNGRTVPTVI